MRKALTDLPVLDEPKLRQKVGEWDSLLHSGPGSNRVVVEWSVSTGVNCFVFPAADRSSGVSLTTPALQSKSGEPYADYLEFTFVPHVAEVIRETGVPVQVNCVDLRPVQTQRARRRAIEAIAHEKTGAAAHH